MFNTFNKLLVVVTVIKAVNAIVYRDFKEFVRNETLEFGVLLIPNIESIMLRTAKEDLFNIAEFKSFMVDMLMLNLSELDSFQVAHYRTDWNAEVMIIANIWPHNAWKDYLEGKEDSRTLTVFRDLKNAGMPAVFTYLFNLTISDVHLDNIKLADGLNKNRQYANNFFFVVVISEPEIYCYEYFVEHFDKIRETLTTKVEILHTGMILGLVIPPHRDFAVHAMILYRSLLARFLYRWGEERKQKVALYHYFYDKNNMQELEPINHIKLLPSLRSLVFVRLGLNNYTSLKTTCGALKLPLLRSRFEFLLIAFDRDIITPLFEYYKRHGCDIPVALQYYPKQNKVFSPQTLISILINVINITNELPNEVQMLIVPAYVIICNVTEASYQIPVIESLIRELQSKRVLLGAEESILQNNSIPTNIDCPILDMTSKTSVVLVSEYHFELEETFDIDMTSEIRNISKFLTQLDTSFRAKFGKKKMLFKAFWNKTDTDGECFKYKFYWEAVLNWAKVHRHFLVAVGGLTSPEEDTVDFTSRDHTPLLKDIFISYSSHINLEAQTYLSNIDDACIEITSKGIQSPTNFNTSLVGVTFNYNEELYSNKPPDNLTELLRIIHTRFNKAEVVLPQEKDHLLRSADRFADAVDYLSHRKNPLQYYFNLGSWKVPKENFEALFPKLFRRAVGVHINFPANADKKQDGFIHQTLIFLRKVVDQVGILVDLEDDFSLTEIHLAKVDYLMLNVNISSIYKILGKYNDVHWKLVDTSILNAIISDVRDLKFKLNYVSPNTKLLVRIAYPTTEYKAAIENYLWFWQSVNEVFNRFNIPFFINHAFDDESDSSIRFGWWGIKNYTTYTGNALDFLEKQSEYFGLEFTVTTELPETTTTFDVPTGSNYGIVGTVSGFLLALLVLALAICRFQMLKRKYLITREEYSEFEDGIVSKNEKNDESKILGLKYDKKKYEIQKYEFNISTSSVIGFGNFGIVYRCRMSRFDADVAVKVPKAPGRNELLSVMREIKVMIHLGEHANVVQLLGAYTKELRTGHVLIVTELMENGSLLRRLKELKKDTDSMSNELLVELCCYCHDISLGVQYLHEKGVVHGDLAARNILLSDCYVCKLGDFGFSKKLYEEKIYQQKNSKPLPWAWCALETLLSAEFSFKSDIWSMGVTFWEVFTLGHQPHHELNWDQEFTQKLSNGLKLPKPKQASEEIYSELLKCWDIEPEMRPEAGHFVSFFRELKMNEYVELEDFV